MKGSKVWHVCPLLVTLLILSVLASPLLAGCLDQGEGGHTVIRIEAWSEGTNGTMADGRIVLNQSRTQQEMPQLAVALDDASDHGAATISDESIHNEIFVYLNDVGEEQGVGPGPQWLVAWGDEEYLIMVIAT